MTIAQCITKLTTSDDLYGCSATNKLFVLAKEINIQGGRDYIVICDINDLDWKMIFAYPNSRNIPHYLKENTALEFHLMPLEDRISDQWQIMAISELVEFNNRGY